MIPSREHFLLKRRSALSTLSFSPTLTVDILFHLPLPFAFVVCLVIISIYKNYVKLFYGIFPFSSYLFDCFRRKMEFVRKPVQNRMRGACTTGK